MPKSNMPKSSIKPNRLQPSRLKERAASSSPSSQGMQRQDVPEGVIRKLSDLLKTTDLAEIEVTTEKMSIRVRAREGFPSMPTNYVVQTSSAAPVGGAAMSSAPTPAPEAQSDLHIIRSPFVGTFYRSPSPQSPPFVEQGQAISKGQSLCIVEAMKLMNEIEADCSGIIERVFAENGVPVEFNSPLFGIRKS